MMHRSDKLATIADDELPATVIATVEPVVSAAQSRSSAPSSDVALGNGDVVAMRIGSARRAADSGGGCMREVLLAASSCLLMPVFSNPVPVVSCNLPAESWFERGAPGLLSDVAELLAARRPRLKFEVPYTLLSRSGDVVPEILASAGFAAAPLWVQLDRQTPPLIAELRRFEPQLIIAPDDLAAELRDSAAAREDLRYFQGLAAAVGCPLLVPMVGAAEQIDCIVRMGGNLVAGMWPSSTLAASRSAANGARTLH